jgi:pantetheine-phosphate adenylyltransferase
VPGSFDPITNGHVDIIRQASEHYDRVYVAVMINSQKRYMFSIEERKKIAEYALIDFKNVSVISSEGWLWELAKELDACAIVKGYRNDVDLAYEQDMANFNKEKYPLAETVLIKSSTALENMSSTVVREMILKGEALDGYLPKGAIEAIKQISKK